MKMMIAVAGLLAVTTAAAQELKFGDVNYFLKAHQQNVTFDVSQQYYKSKSGTDQLPAGYPKQRTLETRGNLLSATYTYAFTDRVNAFFGLDYMMNNQTEDRTNYPAPPSPDNRPNANSFYSNGLSNPTIGANVRLANQDTSGMNFDLGVVAKINVQDAERGVLGLNSQNGKDGNYADGRNSLELNARFGKKWNEANEWQLAAGFVYFQDGEYEQKLAAGGKATVDQDSSHDIYLRAAYQYRPVNEFMVLLSAQATRVGEVDGDIDADEHLDMDFRFTAKYLITESFIAKFNYGMSNNEDYDIGNSEEKNRRENFFGLGVDFLF